MISRFGTQTITLRSVTLGAPGRQGIKAKTGVSTQVDWCRFRPVSPGVSSPLAEPTGGNTDVITQMFKATVPPVAAALAADETWELDYAAAPYAGTYSIVEVDKYPDRSGAIAKVTILCRKWVS